MIPRSRWQLTRLADRALRMPRHLASVHRGPHPAAPENRRAGHRLQLFNLDLHIGVISDLKDLFNDLGVGITDWTLSGHADVIGRHIEPVRVVNELTWRSMGPQMVDEFDRRYGTFLSGFDGFVCTHTPSFIPLFMRYGKPIIGVASTRYEQPFTADPERWRWLDSQLKAASASGQLALVANNRADREYLRRFTGLDAELISSVCRYPNAPFTGRRDVFAIASKSPELDRLIEVAAAGGARSRKELFPLRPTWKAMHDVHGWVHVPYNISQMALFEQHYAGVPIFIPDDRFLVELRGRYPQAVLSQLSFRQVAELDPSVVAWDDPNKVDNPEVLHWWLDRADFAAHGALTGVIRFGSFNELADLLRSCDVEAIAETYRATNRARERTALAQWESLLARHFDL